jgi:hypothetical protein
MPFQPRYRFKYLLAYHAFGQLVSAIKVARQGAVPRSLLLVS